MSAFSDLWYLTHADPVQALIRHGCSARSRDFQVVGGLTAVNSRQEGRRGEARFEFKAGAAGVGESGVQHCHPVYKWSLALGFW